MHNSWRDFHPIRKLTYRLGKDGWKTLYFITLNYYWIRRGIMFRSLVLIYHRTNADASKWLWILRNFHVSFAYIYCKHLGPQCDSLIWFHFPIHIRHMHKCPVCVHPWVALYISFTALRNTRAYTNMWPIGLLFRALEYRTHQNVTPEVKETSSNETSVEITYQKCFQIIRVNSYCFYLLTSCSLRY